MPNSQQRLKSVSRSMYLSFAVLPAALREPMGLAYMLCRAADTLADGTALPVHERLAHLQTYMSLFQRFPLNLEQARSFSAEISEIQFTDVEADQQLLRHLTDCFQSLAALSLTDQALIGNVVKAVIRGMEQDLATFAENSLIAQSFASSADLERYLQSIGGEPGRFWTESMLAHLPNLRLINRERWIEDGIIFGTGLQMVNILRDLPADLKRGRCYIPTEILQKYRIRLEDLVSPPPHADSEKAKALPEFRVPHLIEDEFRTLYVDLIEQTRMRLLRGIDYLAQIPGRYWGCRAAVVWPLLIGLETIKRLKEARSVLNARERIKVKRSEIYRLMASTMLLIPFQKQIEQRARSIY